MKLKLIISAIVLTVLCGCAQTKSTSTKSDEGNAFPFENWSYWK